MTDQAERDPDSKLDHWYESMVPVYIVFVVCLFALIGFGIWLGVTHGHC